MARKMNEWYPRHGPTTKIGLSDGCWKIWLPLGCHDGTVSIDLEAIWGMSVKTGYEKLHLSAVFVAGFSVES